MSISQRCQPHLTHLFLLVLLLVSLACGGEDLGSEDLAASASSGSVSALEPPDDPCPTCRCFLGSDVLAADVDNQGVVTAKAVLSASSCATCKWPLVKLEVQLSSGAIEVLDIGSGQPGAVVSAIDLGSASCVSLRWIEAAAPGTVRSAPGHNVDR